jgi:hypothetical protein
MGTRLFAAQHGAGRTRRSTLAGRGSGALGILAAAALALPWMVTTPATAGNVAPTVVVTSPLGGNVSDLNLENVTATGTYPTEDGSEQPISFQLLIDGGDAFRATAGCVDAVTAASCGTRLAWLGAVTPGAHTLQVVMTTGNGSTVASATVAVNVVTPLNPTMVVSGPLESTLQPSPVTVTATGTVDPALGDRPLGMTLFLGLGWDFNVPYAGLEPCQPSADPMTCTVTFSVAGDALGPGSRLEYHVVMTTAQAEAFGNGPVVGPTVVLSSPASGNVLRGTTTVQASGSADATSGDSPRTLDVSVDGAPIASPMACAATASDSCSLEMPFDTTTLTDGQHQLAAVLTTATTTITSAPVTVTVDNADPPPYAPIVTHADLKLARTTVKSSATHGAVHGMLRDAATHQVVTGAAVTVTYAPALGRSVKVVVRTKADGAFSARDPAVLDSNTVVTASTTRAYGGAVTTTRFAVPAHIRCSAGAVRHSRRAVVTCAVPGLKAGAKVSLVSITSTSTKVVARGSAKGGRVVLTFTPTGKARLVVQARVAASAAFAASQSPRYQLRVR